jgi:hypothetical protein
MWKLIDRFADNENNYGVLQGLLGKPFQTLARSCPDRIAAIASNIFAKVRDKSGAKPVKQACVRNFLQLYLLYNNNHAQAAIETIITEPKKYAPELWSAR